MTMALHINKKEENMETLLNLFVSIVSQPAILVSLIALLGLVLQKRNFLMLFKER